ncbi:MAG TPA: CDP-glycerol glycerophosphotransferase family protein [Oleiagrimonas sp.]|nr:CDP-glycerol glycerophosphotransferase family protein [Oleiagrimonas sp.]
MKYIYYITRLFRQVVGMPVYLASFVFRRSKEVWVFGEWHGKRYADNAKYLFEYVSRNHGNIHAVWMSTDREVIARVRGDGFHACHSRSWRGAAMCLKASVHFVTHDAGDTNEFFSGGSLLVNLTHGTPLKRIGNDARYARLGMLTSVFDTYGATVIPRKRRFDIISCADNIAARRFATAFPSAGKVTGPGYPRWDGLVGSAKSLPIDAELGRFSHVISYLPTVRFCNQRPYDPFAITGLYDFMDYLQRNDVLFLVRTHPTVSFENKVPRSENIMLVDSHLVPDTCDILRRTDLLVTDYSSVMFDYAMLRRPTLLLAPDREVYLREDVGIYGDYSTDSLHPIFDDWSQLSGYLQDNSDVLDRVQDAPAFVEGEASRRIVKYVQHALGPS